MRSFLFIAFVSQVLLAIGCGPPPSPPPPPPDFSHTVVTGKLGDLGDAKPIVSSFYISNSGETLVYISTQPLSCNGLTISRWLGQTPPDTQVVEVIVKGDPEVKTYAVPPGEINYAKGGRSSSFEVNADSGSITYHTVKPSELVEGLFSAKYGADTVSGTFHATFCDGGQDW